MFYFRMIALTDIFSCGYILKWFSGNDYIARAESRPQVEYGYGEMRRLVSVSTLPS